MLNQKLYTSPVTVKSWNIMWAESFMLSRIANKRRVLYHYWTYNTNLSPKSNQCLGGGLQQNIIGPLYLCSMHFYYCLWPVIWCHGNCTLNLSPSSAIKSNKKIYINFHPLKSCDIVGTKLGNIKKNLALIADSLHCIRHTVAALQLILICTIYLFHTLL